MVKIFLSHSSKDGEVAELLIELFRSALSLNSDEIRCTSVDGYRLSVGANVDEQLRQEIFESVAFIGLLSQSSLRSTYVLFELGARWGAKKHLLPLLLSDVRASDLKSPLSGLNALRCDERSHLQQLLYDLAQYLSLPIGNPAAYEKYIQRIIESVAEPLVILRPYDGDKVPRRPIVEGVVRNPNSEIWLVVHPLGNPNYWVQPKPEVKKDGKWKAQIYIGREGTADVGTYYEVRAIANPQTILKDGEVLISWPPAEYCSDIIELLRK